MENQKLRILFFTNIPSPYRVAFFNELGKYCDLTVCFEGKNATDRDDKWRADSARYFSQVFLNGIRTGADNFLCLGIQKYLRLQWDHIIIGGYSTPTQMLAIEYLRIKKIPFIFEADGGFIKEDKKMIYTIKRHFISSADMWLSTGKMTTDYFVHYGAEQQRCYIYPFTSLVQKDIDNTLISHDEKIRLREKLNMTESRIIITVGQFIYRKGFDVLLKAMNAIPEDVGVYFIGGVPTEEYLEIQRQNGLDNAHFIGFKTKDELNEYYRAADLFVLPTREDIWGLVINEAMAKGLPVITTDKCGAGLELVRDNGRIISADYVTELAEAINELLRDENVLRRMSERSLEIIQGYTIEKMTKEHIAIWNNELQKD